ncbi:MAG: alpha/beta hydrolase [Actinomycetota bacterium]
MSSLTPTAASDLFRRAPERLIDLGDRGGAVAHRRVGNGPDVLFVHGWPVSGATFRHLLPHMAEHVTCHLIDLPGAGQSGWDDATDLSVDNHVRSVQGVLDALDLSSVAVIGHDSGGMIARHAVAGDQRVRAMGLINTEIPGGNSWRFNSFVSAVKLPGFGTGLGWLAGKPRLRRTKFVLGDAFADRSLLDGEFDEFFLRPLHEDPRALAATMQLGRSFEKRHVSELTGLHAKIEVPVQLVWGDQDRFFPVANARKMVTEFPNATITEVPGAGLFSHEEAPASVAAALLPTLTAR